MGVKGTKQSFNAIHLAAQATPPPYTVYTLYILQ